MTISKRIQLLVFALAPVYLFGIEGTTTQYSDSAVLSNSWHLCDRKGNVLCFDWITQGDLCQEEQLYMESFEDLYKDVPDSYFGPLGRTGFLKHIFEEEKTALDKRFFISVKKDTHVVGFASFKKTECSNKVYLKLIVVDKTYRGCGIGEELILTILKKLPSTKKIVLDTLKKNHGAIGFYKKLGFKECACIEDFPKEVIKWYTGFEGKVAQLAKNIKRMDQIVT